VIVCDTSPLNYLVIIGLVDVLAKLFKDVYAPPEVLRELLHLVLPRPFGAGPRVPPHGSS